MIEIRNLSKSYGLFTALKNIDLRLDQGLTHVFLGSSGSGKSTLLKMISGLEKPDNGSLVISGKNQIESSQKKISSEIGYVLQDACLFPHLNCLQNIILPAKISKWSSDKISNRVHELREIMQLPEKLLTKYPQELSGGQRQRIALMRSLLLNPPIILLDEPLGALDPIVRADLQKDLKQVFNLLNKTVIIVTHDINEAAFFGHTISLFHEGQLIQHGNFESFMKNPANEFVTRFMNAQKPSAELLNYL
ncbi:MAG: ATP-binding cassette domain-containing protein [Bdellovibrio sp.]|nr:ATP-binding cassette domain-containing protein [Bdellovibrio sp.]